MLVSCAAFLLGALVTALAVERTAEPLDSAA
jgi:hypothetical protein